MADVEFRTPYPDYDVLEKWDSASWNDVTRRVVTERLDHVPPRRFLSEAAYALVRCLADTVLPQPERTDDQRIPVEAFIDQMLFDNRTDGTRYADALPMRATWQRGLEAIDMEAARRFGAPFVSLGQMQRHAVLDAIHDGEVDESAWTGLHPKRFFRHVLLTTMVKIYYSHPHAWSEIGFGGPAAPRGYVRLGPDQRDPWEAEEQHSPQPVEPLP